MPNKKISQLDVRSSPTLADLLAIADPSTGYAYKITGTNLQTVLEIPNKVPYTGATAAVNLGVYGLTSDYLQLSTSPTASGAVGRTLWNDQIGSTETTLKGGSVVLKNGVDLVARVVNKVTPAATLTKATYKAVRVSGAQGQRLAIAYAQANTDNNSADTIGLVCETIAANQEGFIITVGQLTGINTTGSLQGETWADGDVLYLSPTTAGNLTNIKPNGSTGHIVVIGYVEYAHANNGSIYVKIMNGWELDELHNVYINAVANNQVLVYESSTDLWKNKSIATILGYTPANDSLVVHLAGAETITGVKTFQNALQTTAGNNLLNTGGGNTVIGYTADPATSTLYKLDVNGKTKTATLLVNDGGTYSIEYNASTTNGKLLSKGSYPSFTLQTAAGQNRVNIENGGPNAIIQMWYGTTSNIYLDTNADGYYALGFAYGKTSAPVASAILELSATNRGFLLPRMTTAQKTAITTPATSLMVYDTDLAAFQYYTGSAWAGLGGGITGSGTAGQVTYWSGTSAVTGSSNLFWDNTNARLGIGTSSPGVDIDVSKSVGSSGTVFIRATNTSSTGEAGLLVRNEVSEYGALEIFGSSWVGATQRNLVSFTSGAANGFNVILYNNNANAHFRITSTTSQTERFRVFGNNGNVLIQNGGTFTDGGQRLQVIGSMRVGSTAASAMYWDDTNNRLGIGTSSPTTQFQVEGSSAGISLHRSGGNEPFIRLSDNTVTSGGQIRGVISASGLIFTDVNAGNTWLKIFGGTGNVTIQNGGTHTDGGQRLQVIGSMRVGTTAASAMYWDDTNNRLGIGTSSPTTSLTIKKSGLALEVLDASNNQKFAVTDNTVTGSSYIFLTRSDNTKDIFQVFFPTGTLTSSNVNWNFGMNGNSNDFVIASYDGTSVTNRMRFGNSGLNAIGTQTPTSAFDITGSTTSRSSLRIRSGTAPTSPNDGDIWYDGTNIYIRVGTTTKTFTII